MTDFHEKKIPFIKRICMPLLFMIFSDIPLMSLKMHTNEKHKVRKLREESRHER